MTTKPGNNGLFLLEVQMSDLKISKKTSNKNTCKFCAALNLCNKVGAITVRTKLNLFCKAGRPIVSKTLQNLKQRRF